MQKKGEDQVKRQVVPLATPPISLLIHRGEEIKKNAASRDELSMNEIRIVDEASGDT